MVFTSLYFWGRLFEYAARKDRVDTADLLAHLLTALLAR